MLVPAVYVGATQTLWYWSEHQGFWCRSPVQTAGSLLGWLAGFRTNQNQLAPAPTGIDVEGRVLEIVNPFKRKQIK
jgi:hypothetical protein